MMYQREEMDEERSHECALVRATPPPLAWDKNGHRFSPPAKARRWRVQRKADSNAKGRPAPIFGPDGPLHIELQADFEALAAAVNHQPGWYILHATDEEDMLIPDVPAAHVKVVVEGPSARSEPAQENSASTIERLCLTVQQLALYSVQRDEALCAALSQMTNAVSEIQKSAAELVRAASSGLEIATGASLLKVPPPPPAPQLPPPPPSKNFMDFLTSPTGNTIAEAVSSVATSLARNLEPNS